MQLPTHKSSVLGDEGLSALLSNWKACSKRLLKGLPKELRISCSLRQSTCPLLLTYLWLTLLAAVGGPKKK